MSFDGAEYVPQRRGAGASFAASPQQHSGSGSDSNDLKVRKPTTMRTSEGGGSVGTLGSDGASTFLDDLRRLRVLP